MPSSFDRGLSAHSYAISEVGADSYGPVSSAAELAGEPLLAAFYAHWRDLAGGLAMPRVADFDPFDLPRAALPYVVLVEVVGLADAPRFKVRLMGTQAVEQSGLDSTGRFVDEVAGAEGVQRRFSEVLRRRQPYYADMRLTWSSRNYKRYRTVVCPLADDADAGRVARLLSLVVFT